MGRMGRGEEFNQGSSPEGVLPLIVLRARALSNVEAGPTSRNLDDEVETKDLESVES